MIIPSHDDGIGYGMGFALWCLIYTAITNNRNVDLTTKKEKNIVSLIHASSVSILFLINFLIEKIFTEKFIPTTYFMYFSISFYLIDLYADYLTSYNINYSTITHHILTMISLLYIKEHYFVYQLLILMEISNVPMYIVYHQICNGQVVCKTDIYFEIVFYVCSRVLIGSYVVIYSYKCMDLLLKSIVFIIGVMSLYWTRKLFKQLSTFDS